MLAFEAGDPGKPRTCLAASEAFVHNLEARSLESSHPPTMPTKRRQLKHTRQKDNRIEHTLSELDKFETL